MQQLIDIACMQNSQKQTRYTLLQQANVTDRQTDRQMLDHFTDPAPHTMQAVSTFSE